MTDYLIRHITDSTGHTFTEVIKLRENERYEIVSAESKEEAEEMAKRPKGLLEVVPSSFNNNSVGIAAIKSFMFVEENEKGE